MPQPHAVPTNMLGALPVAVGRVFRWILILVPMWCGQLTVAAVLDTSSQSPLTSRVAAPPQPNVFVTLDTSGSMGWDFMPEGDTKVNGVTVRLGSGNDFVPAGFPNDIFNYGACVVQGIKNASPSSDSLYQKQYRSPDVNSLYYNPDIRYRPWVSPTLAPASMANARTVDPLWDPMGGAKTTDTSVDGQSPVTGYKLNATQNIRARWCNGYNSASENYTAQDFSPGLVYRLAANGSPQDGAKYVRYDVNGGTDYSPTIKHVNRTDCVAAKCSQAEELQNFANWFTYYRNRHLLARAALGLSLANFVDKIRVGWATYTNANGSQTLSLSGNQFVRPMTAARLNQVLTGFYSAYPGGDTPTREVVQMVGNYFKSGTNAYADSENPWLVTPGAAGSGFHACMRSAHLLISDGYYNDSVTVGNIDNTAGPDHGSAENNPQGFHPTQYTPSLPFLDNYAGTLADVVMKYYVNDLQSAIDNKISPIDGDIAYWQHLTQFMVGLGVSGTLDASSDAAKRATLRAIKAGTAAWPNPASGDPQKIDDMWHAAVNTGGDYFPARDPAGFIANLGDTLGRAAGQQSKAAGVAVTSPTQASGHLKLVPKYVSGSWYGDLEAYALDASGSVGTDPIWTASANLPPAANRNLYTWSGSAAVPFTWDAMGPGNQSLVKTGLATDADAANLAGFIRGESGNEGSSALFRSRGGRLLGDFVDSPPVFVKDQVDLGYDDLETGYRAYVNKKMARTDGVVVLGGNAGVIHAFNAANGAEVFGYLPQAGLSKLSKVAAKNYGTPANDHQFFVNGPVVETDAYITTPRSPAVAAWSNLILTSMGVGAKGFFALHIPTAMPTQLDANTVLWESSVDADIGHVIGEMAVGKMRGGGWKAFVGNGVDSANGTATLLVVNLATGSIEKKLTVDSAPGNGLLGVTLLRDKNKEVVGAYAGDLKGNLWRFDFEGGSVADWKIGFGGTALFQAKFSSAAQAITVAPQVVTRVAGGRMVLFGTGRLLTSGDADSTATQSYYGVLDPTGDGLSSVATVSPFASIGDARSVLAPMTVSATPKSTVNGVYHDVVGNAVNWNHQKGWYIDLPVSGQRVIHPSLILANDHVLIQSMVPASAATACSVNTGTGYNYVVNALDGQMSSVPVFDTNGDGTVNSADAAAAGYQTASDGRDQWVASTSNPNAGFICGTSKCVAADLGCPAGACCGASCPPRLTVRDRIWRRIVNPPSP